jgi:hypothetical protein
MRTCHLGIALFALGALGASSAWGSVEPAGKLRPSPVASVLPTVLERGQLGVLDARAFDQFSEIILVAFADKDKPPPKRSRKCPPDHGGKNDHDCRVDK